MASVCTSHCSQECSIHLVLGRDKGCRPKLFSSRPSSSCSTHQLAQGRARHILQELQVECASAARSPPGGPARPYSRAGSRRSLDVPPKQDTNQAGAMCSPKAPSWRLTHARSEELPQALLPTGIPLLPSSQLHLLGQRQQDCRGGSSSSSSSSSRTATTNTTTASGMPLQSLVRCSYQCDSDEEREEPVPGEVPLLTLRPSSRLGHRSGPLDADLELPFSAPPARSAPCAPAPPPGGRGKAVEHLNRSLSCCADTRGCVLLRSGLWPCACCVGALVLLCGRPWLCAPVLACSPEQARVWP